VRGAALVAGRVSIDGRAHERVAERERPVELDQACFSCALKCGVGQARARKRALERRQVADLIRGRQQQRPPNRRRQRTHTCAERLLDGAARRGRTDDRLGALKLAIGQRGR